MPHLTESKRFEASAIDFANPDSGSDQNQIWKSEELGMSSVMNETPVSGSLNW